MWMWISNWEIRSTVIPRAKSQTWIPRIASSLKKSRNPRLEMANRHTQQNQGATGLIELLSRRLFRMWAWTSTPGIRLPCAVKGVVKGSSMPAAETPIKTIFPWKKDGGHLSSSTSAKEMEGKVPVGP